MLASMSGTRYEVADPDIPKLHDVPIIPSGWVCMTVARLRGEMYVTSKSVSDETDAEPVVRDLRRVDLYDAWDELRNAEAGKTIALDGPDEGTCIGRVASPVEDSTSTMLACLSEAEGPEDEDENSIATPLFLPVREYPNSVEPRPVWRSLKGWKLGVMSELPTARGTRMWRPPPVKE